MSDPNRFYIDIDTQDRVPATYQVYLTMPASYDAHVEIEATSEEEASEIALARARGWMDADWECDGGDPHNIDARHVECEEPPENTMLIRQGFHTDARLDALFEIEPTAAPAICQKEQ